MTAILLTFLHRSWMHFFFANNKDKEKKGPIFYKAVLEHVDMQQQEQQQKKKRGKDLEPRRLHMLGSYFHDWFNFLRLLVPRPTFYKVEALIERIDDVVARVQSHHAELDRGQEVWVLIDLIQCVMKGFQRLDPVVFLFSIVFISMKCISIVWATGSRSKIKGWIYGWMDGWNPLGNMQKRSI